MCIIDKAICRAQTSSFGEVYQVIEPFTVSVSVYDLHEKDHKYSENEEGYLDIEACQVRHSSFLDN